MIYQAVPSGFAWFYLKKNLNGLKKEKKFV